MKMRIIKLVSLCGVVALALTACGTTADDAKGKNGDKPSGGDTITYAPSAIVKPKDGKKLKVGVTFPMLDQFLQTVADGVRERAKADGIDVEIVSAQEKTDVQLGQVENMINNKVDGMIVVPVATDSTVPITKKAQAAKIPLVYMNRRPSELPKGVPYVGSNSLVAGEYQMQALADMLGHKGNVAILEGDPANESTTLRTKGCENIIAKYPGMKVVRKQAGNWYRDKGLAITENWIQSGVKIDAICSNNDDMALGAIQALKAAGKLDKVKIGGVDATNDALNAMEAGQLKVTVFQDAKGQGGGAVDTVIKMYNKEKVPSVLDVPYQLVTPDNIKKFRKR